MPGVSDARNVLLVLDVRPTLARGAHPLVEVLAAADALAPQGVLELIAPFEPRPLMAKLRERGCEVTSHLEPDGTWLVRAGHPRLAPLMPLAHLPAPEPMEQVLHAAARLAPGEVVTAHLPRDPQLLKPELSARGLTWCTAPRPDGTAVLWMRR